MPLAFFDVGNVLVWIVWLAAAFACLASGVAVVSFSNPFFSALALIGNLSSLAVLYLLLSAEFVAAAQSEQPTHFSRPFSCRQSRCRPRKRG